MKVDKFSATALFAFFIFLKIASGQSLRGLVREAKTGDGLYSANVFLMEKSDSALVATTTDLSGGFQIKAPKPGIFSLKINQIGFETRIIPEVELNFGKETILEISLNEAPGELKSVEIRPDGSDGRLPMAGLHLLTRDQVLRYPATFFDPARLAQSLPGVSNDDQNNGISVRGLTPALFQYRIEGLEVVNPNHLSNAGTITDLPTANSGGVSMLSAQMLGNSAIYTGTTPVGYGNSVGGLMDIRLRPGNNEHFEGTVQAGLVGLDASVEGPFSKYKKSSYLVNYRYSTIGLLEKLGVQLGDEVVNFQDLSVFLKFPIGQRKTLSFFTVLGKSSNVFTAKDPGERKIEKDFQNIDFSQKSLIVGVNFRKTIGGIRQFNLGYAFSSSVLDRRMDREEGYISSDFNQFYLKNSLRACFHNRLFGKLPFEWGSEMEVSVSNYESHLGVGEPGINYYRDPSTVQLREFAQVTVPAGKVCSFNFGFRILQTEPVSTNQIFAFHPQGSFSLKLGERDRFVCSLEKTAQQSLAPDFPTFLTTNAGLTSFRGNARLEKFLNNQSKLAVGGFYQKFLKFPITSVLFGTSSPLDGNEFMATNFTSTFGDAYLGGLEASLSRPFSNGYFYEINASVFDAKQEIRPGDFITTRFNSRWTTNFLTGKDWQKTFENGTARTLGINLRIHTRGGFWETPIDKTQSQAQKTTIFETGSENSLRLPTYFRSDLRLFWKKNKKNRTGTLALDVQNVTNRLNVAWHYYDPFLEEIVAKTGLGLVPILSYRLEFQQKK